MYKQIYTCVTNTMWKAVRKAFVAVQAGR